VIWLKIVSARRSVCVDTGVDSDRPRSAGRQKCVSKDLGRARQNRIHGQMVSIYGKRRSRGFQTAKAQGQQL